MNPQQTIARRVSFSGIGLHSGEKISCALIPAPADTGIVFHIIGENGRRTAIHARFQNIGELLYNTGLKKEGLGIRTVEHLLSALHGFHIDNLIIELDNCEVPVMDGSAAPFVYLLSEAGIVHQDAPRRTVRLAAPLKITHDKSWIEALPTDSNHLSVYYTIDFNHPVIGRMSFEFNGDPTSYAQFIAPARTFGFLREVDRMRRKGLIKGADINNAVVLNDHKVISGRLRFRNEFVRHKILDFWGDIYLLGHPLIAKIKAFRAGHKLHAELVEKMLKTPGILVPVKEKTPYRILNLQPQQNPT